MIKYCLESITSVLRYAVYEVYGHYVLKIFNFFQRPNPIDFELQTLKSYACIQTEVLPELRKQMAFVKWQLENEAIGKYSKLRMVKLTRPGCDGYDCFIQYFTKYEYGEYMADSKWFLDYRLGAKQITLSLWHCTINYSC